LHVDVSAANVNDHRMFEDMVDGVRPVRQPVGRPRKRPAKLHGDKGYDYPECRALLRGRNIIARIARKGIESSTRLGRHRYVIERCLEWTTRFRRLVRRYEREASHFPRIPAPGLRSDLLPPRRPAQPVDQQQAQLTHGL
jgi:hypothetical protein